MADVLNKTTKQYLSSVNTPDFLDSNWIINPDTNIINFVQQKYWIIDGDSLRVATDEEKAEIDLISGFENLSIEEVKAKLNKDINLHRDQLIDGGVIFRGNLFDSDSRARENIVGMCSAISLGVPFPSNFTWRSQMNEDIPMGVNDLKEFGVGVLTYVSSCFAVSWFHKDLLNAMTSTDISDYLNYNYEIGWPSKSIDGSSI